MNIQQPVSPGSPSLARYPSFAALIEATRPTR
jgi:hypothetical protein